MSCRDRLPWLLILAAGAARLVPHVANVAPVGGLGLYAGARLPWPAALAAPALAMLVGDALGDVTGGGYPGIVMVSVYLGLLGGPLAGRWLLARGFGAGRFSAAVLAGALWFFALSNLGMWASGIGSFPLTGTGLRDCYLAGLPFLARSLAADALAAGVLFGAEALARRFRSRATAAALT